ncbi:C-type lectin domain family 4 member G-like [Falco rusticolus]|uniref:C-type lectin domain family 4 member G-like n=1 Tax=Falco rusticolus TaxID=120794 RepID=UPI0018868586|nr:C-type lectin domain family 4 member G-like [Falco rusticolus]
MGQRWAGGRWLWDMGAPSGLCLLLVATSLAWGGLLGVLLGRHAALSQEIRRLREGQELLAGNGSALALALAMLERNQTQLQQLGAETATLLEVLSANQSATRMEVSGTMVAVWRDRDDTRAALHQLLLALWAHNGSGCAICPPGWRLHGGSCYRFGRGAAGWAQAQGLCREQGAQLAVIGDPQEQSFLAGISPPHDSWIGLHDRSSEGSFQWVDGSPSTYRNWRWGQPDEAGGGEDCVAMDPRGGVGGPALRLRPGGVGLRAALGVLSPRPPRSPRQPPPPQTPRSPRTTPDPPRDNKLVCDTGGHCGAGGGT